MYPHAIISGIDLSAKRIVQASKAQTLENNLSVLSGNVYLMPFRDNCFDFVFSRLLFEYLKNPQKALSEMKRVCKTGGTIMVQDLDGQFSNNYPVDREIENGWHNIFSQIQKTGFDPDIGRKLFSFFYKENLDNIDVKIENYHLIAGKISLEDENYWKNKLSSVSETFPKYTSLKSEIVSEISGNYLDYLRKAETISFSNLFTVYGVKK